MPSRPCLTCGDLSDGSYCPKHRPARTGKPRPGSGWQASKWRAKILHDSGGRCVVTGCATPHEGVQAHHLRPVSQTGTIDGPGVALCRDHHEQITRATRLHG